MKWKLRKVDVDIKETLTCVLARSILIYIGTPLVAAGLWKREDIDRTEAQLYRSMNNLPNVISNRALMNLACGLKERLGHCGAPGSEGQPPVQEADPY